MMVLTVLQEFQVKAVVQDPMVVAVMMVPMELQVFLVNQGLLEQTDLQELTVVLVHQVYLV
jgi:hypothetical protein